MCRPYYDRFADSHEIVYLDHRGNGRSDQRKDASGWDLDTWADDVVRFCDAVDITKPVVMGGSFGGFGEMRYASRHPDHPAKLVLASTAARRHTEWTARRFEELGGPRTRELYERVFVRGEPFDPEYLTVNMPLYNRVPSPFGPRRTWQNLQVEEHFNMTFVDGFDLRDDMRKVTAPTLVLAGADDPMTPASASEEIMSLLPEGVGRLEIADDCARGGDERRSAKASLR